MSLTIHRLTPAQRAEADQQVTARLKESTRAEQPFAHDGDHCSYFVGARRHGESRVLVGGMTQEGLLVHHLYWEQKHGRIPDGHHLWDLCGVWDCRVHRAAYPAGSGHRINTLKAWCLEHGRDPREFVVDGVLVLPEDLLAEIGRWNGSRRTRKCRAQARRVAEAAAGAVSGVYASARAGLLSLWGALHRMTQDLRGASSVPVPPPKQEAPKPTEEEMAEVCARVVLVDMTCVDCDGPRNSIPLHLVLDGLDENLTTEELYRAHHNPEDVVAWLLEEYGASKPDVLCCPWCLNERARGAARKKVA